jgi:hypothetical protein
MIVGVISVGVMSVGVMTVGVLSVRVMTLSHVIDICTSYTWYTSHPQNMLIRIQPLYNIYTMFFYSVYSAGVALTYFTIQESFELVILTYGLMFGLGVGIAYAVPLNCGHKVCMTSHEKGYPSLF